MIYGYCRGKSKQEADRQEASIRKMYPDAMIYRDHGYKTNRGGCRVEKKDDWNFVRVKGEDRTCPTLIFDTIYAIPISRRTSAERMLDQYICWINAGTTLIFIKEPYINSEMFEGMEASLNRKNSHARQLLERLIQLAYDEAQARHTTAQKAVETKKAQQAADDTIRTIGRPYGTVRVSAKEEMARRYIREYCKDFGGSMTDVAIRKEIKEREGVDIPKTTYERYKKRLRDGVESN